MCSVCVLRSRASRERWAPLTRSPSLFLAGQGPHHREHLPLPRTSFSLHRPARGARPDSVTPSQPKLVPHILPFLRPFVPFLLHQIWPSEQYIRTLPDDIPVLFLAGSRDELVEPGQMKGLWELCRSRTKRWIEFQYGTHSASLLPRSSSSCSIDLR